MTTSPRSAVIIEDEPLARDRLAGLLAEVPWLAVVGMAGDGRRGLALIRERQPDVAFLDISMPGLDGLALARTLADPPLIVYTTAYSEHAVAAFGIGAIDYLVKPFGRRRLVQTLERIEQTLTGAPRPPALTQLFIRHRSAIVPVAIDRVTRFEGRDDYVAVHTGGRFYLADMRLADLERDLPAARFVRIHRSHIINLTAVKEIRPDGTGRLLVTLTDDTTVRSSRDRAARLRELMR